MEHKRYAFTGSGHRTVGDAWLAETGARRVREQRRLARDELRTRSGPRDELVAMAGLA